tara:strand:+ start:117 stop:905 length:789 start_codon:yes stop_codon:yes gene_type:complete
MSEYVEFANELADISGEVIKKYFRTKIEFEDKVDSSPVTIADKNTELLLRQMIIDKYPEHDILGEEFDSKHSGSKMQWILDPIDGTRSFILGLPIFGTLISLLENGIPILGVINIPITGERWVGYKKNNSIFYSKNETKSIRCEVSKQKSISNASLVATDPGMFSNLQKPYFDLVTRKVKMVRFGGDCYSYGLLASGFIDLIIEANMKIFDVMALVPIIQEAGGKITDWKGDNFSDKEWDGSVLASASKELHEKTINLLNKN